METRANRPRAHSDRVLGLDGQKIPRSHRIIVEWWRESFPSDSGAGFSVGKTRSTSISALKPEYYQSGLPP